MYRLIYLSEPCYLNAAHLANPGHETTDWDVISFHVSVLAHIDASDAEAPRARSQHTSAALTINENYDKGQ